MLVLAVAAACIITSLSSAPGITPDSVNYISAAENVLLGNGLCIDGPALTVTPLTHFPPLYPLALAGMHALTAHINNAIWVVNFVALLVSLAFFWTLARGVSGAIPATIALVGFALAPITLRVHGMAWSEGLFVAAVFGSLWAYRRSIDNERAGDRSSDPWLVLSALFAASTLLTRYAGCAVVLTIAACILLNRALSLSARLRRVILFTTLAVAPLAVWNVSGIFGCAGPAQPFGNRTIEEHVVTLEDLLSIVEVLSSWFFDSYHSAPLWGVLCLMLAMLFAALHHTERNDVSSQHTGAHRICMMFCINYFSVLLLAKSFFDAEIPFNERLLYPVLAPIIIIALRYATRPGISATRLATRAVASLIIAGTIGSALSHSPLIERQTWEQHLFYGGPRWQSSPTAAAVRDLPRDIVIASNAPDALRALAARSALALPNRYLPSSHVANPQFTSELQDLIGTLARKNGVVVFFRSVTWRKYLPTETELISAAQDMHCTFAQQTTVADGIILVPSCSLD